ncbi:uncharacterized protein LOC132739860 [Ruditapes philippinarum]|uniref:uncharacterized protein LOC132739860 n=1 Tax=Ruditapes philippinarum TaxID=129788 RepID=UPI00295C22E6|nr:uncharacterized protein LOC132739860 [Ruditapes philippinarum]
MANLFRMINFVVFITSLVLMKEKSTAEILHDFAVKVTSLNYYRSTSGAISELYARGVTECTSICNKTQGCLSFFYNKNDKICQLHDIVYENYEPSLIYVYKTYYYKMYIDPSNFTCTLAPPGAEYHTVMLSDETIFTYRIVWQLADKPTAAAACAAENAVLVRVLTSTKMKLLIHIFTSCVGFVYSGDYWIDGSNANATNFNNTEEWVTSTGVPLSSAGQYWSPGSLLNPETNHCVALWAADDYLWSKLPCSYTYYYICEKI